MARNRASPLSERQLHIAVSDLLRDFCDEDKWRWTHIPLGEYRPVQTAQLLKQMGVRPGWPDFIFVGPLAAICFLELKSRDGDLSEHQLSFFAFMRARGLTCKVARSLPEAAQILGAWGVIPMAIAEQIAR